MEMESMAPPDQPLLEDEKSNSASLGEGDRLGRTRVAFFRVGGMTCAACVSTIESYVGSTDGVEAVSVTLLTERAQVKYNKRKISPKQIAAAIEDIGFTAVEEDKSDVVLLIGGMTCAACTNTVEGVLLGTPGVASATVNLLTGKAKVRITKEKRESNVKFFLKKRCRLARMLLGFVI
jgi:P-type Cu+ transporter